MHESNKSSTFVKEWQHKILFAQRTKEARIKMDLQKSL